MSLSLISQSYFVESDSDIGGDEDGAEGEDKIGESVEDMVKKFMKSKWDYDEEERAPIENPLSPSPDTKPECRLVIEKQLPTSISHSSLSEVGSEEMVDNSDSKSSPEPQEKKGVQISQRNWSLLKRSSFKDATTGSDENLVEGCHSLLPIQNGKVNEMSVTHSKIQATEEGKAPLDPSSSLVCSAIGEREISTDDINVEEKISSVYGPHQISKPRRGRKKQSSKSCPPSSSKKSQGGCPHNKEKKKKSAVSNQPTRKTRKDREDDMARQKILCIGGSKHLSNSNWLCVYRLKRRLCKIQTPYENPVKAGFLTGNRGKGYVPVRRKPQKHSLHEKSGANSIKTKALSKRNLKPNANLNENETNNEVQSLYRCPYCLLIFAMADLLIKHLQSHAGNNCSVTKRGNAHSSKPYSINRMKNEEKLRKPKKSKKAHFLKSLKRSTFKLSKEVPILRPCKIVLSRCDHLISEWKPITTKYKSVLTLDCNKNDLHGSRDGTKRRSAGIDASRKMMIIRMQEEDDVENEERGSSCGPNRLVSQWRSVLKANEVSNGEPSDLTYHVAEQKYRVCDGVDLPSRKSHKGQTTYSGAKQYKCPTCSKTLGHSTNLKRHIRTHTGEKSYNCSTCSKRFGELGNLKRHIRTHTGEKPYNCSTCSKRFGELGNLKRHIRTHTGEKPYNCSTCSRRFGETGSLKRHIRTHTGEKLHIDRSI